MCLTNLLQLLASLLMLCVILPLFITVALVGSICYIFLIKYYLVAARDLKRLEDNRKAPVISHFSETINGTYIIRCFNKQKDFTEKFLSRQHDYVVSFVNMNYGGRFISCLTDIFAVIMITGVCIFSVLSRNFESSSSTDGKTIGLALSWGFSISTLLSQAFRLVADVDQQMNSVVRMKQYIDNNPAERSWTDPKPEKTWPHSGDYQLNNVTYKYREGLPNVIHNISFDIKPCEKIGVVGRTGAGKSTITLGLLRILELAENENVLPHLTQLAGAGIGPSHPDPQLSPALPLPALACRSAGLAVRLALHFYEPCSFC